MLLTGFNHTIVQIGENTHSFIMRKLKHLVKVKLRIFIISWCTSTKKSFRYIKKCVAHEERARGEGGENSGISGVIDWRKNLPIHSQHFHCCVRALLLFSFSEFSLKVFSLQRWPNSIATADWGLILRLIGWQSIENDIKFHIEDFDAPQKSINRIKIIVVLL